MKRSIETSRKQLIQNVKKFRNVKKDDSSIFQNPERLPIQIVQNRAEIMVEFAKQFHKANLTDRSLLPKLIKHRKEKNLPEKLYRGQLTPDVVKAIEDNVLPHFYRHASTTMSILSRNGLDTWSRHIWNNFVKAPEMPLHPLMKSDRALTSFMHASLNLLQPEVALDLYTDHITYKLDKRPVTLALKALGMMNRWDEMKNLLRVYNEKRPYQVDFIMVKIAINAYAKEGKYDEVLSLLESFIRELNDENEIVLMTALYKCDNKEDMLRLLQWSKKVWKNLDKKRHTTIRMFRNASKDFPMLKRDFAEVIESLERGRRMENSGDGQGAVEKVHTSRSHEDGPDSQTTRMESKTTAPEHPMGTSVPQEQV